MKKFLLTTFMFAGFLIANADYTDYYRVYYKGEEVKSGETVYCNNYEDNTKIESPFGVFNSGYTYGIDLSCINQTEDPMILNIVQGFADKPTKEEWEETKSTPVDGTMAYKWGTPSVCYSGAGIDGKSASCIGSEGDVILPDNKHDSFVWEWHVQQTYSGTEELVYTFTTKAYTGDYTSSKLEKYDEIEGSEFTVTVVFGPNVSAPGAIHDIDVESDAEAVYFDLQGRRIQNPSKGLFIVKKGSEVSKQFIR